MTAITIPIATAIALAFRRWALAVSLAISGVAVYVLAKVVKEYVARGRPSAIVPTVRMYVAAHTPLDLIGGAALGVLVASAMNLLFATPNPRRAHPRHSAGT